jgi:hypothetical protein
MSASGTSLVQSPLSFVVIGQNPPRCGQTMNPQKTVEKEIMFLLVPKLCLGTKGVKLCFASGNQVGLGS